MDNKTVLVFMLLIAVTGCNGEQQHVDLVNVRPSLVEMDLSRAPSHTDLIAAGQLGGILTPTEPMKMQSDNFMSSINPFSEDDSDERMAFGRTIQDWNSHKYSSAASDFDKFRKEFPNSSWASEATLHMGCEARFTGQYTKANALFLDVINQNQNKDYIGAKIMTAKARSRLAVLRVMENNPEEAKKLFSQVYQDSPDWRIKTYASTWIRKIAAMEKEAGSLLDCGTRALSYILTQDHKLDDAEQVMGFIPEHENGFSIADLLELSEQYGYQTTALKLSSEGLSSIPLPAIMQVEREDTGGKGHYWVLEEVTSDNFNIYDPQMNRRFHYTSEQLNAEWQGNILVFHNNEAELPGRPLTNEEMDTIYGGCCGVQRPQGDSGSGSDGDNGDDNDDDCSSKGAPVWSVNMVNFNLHVKDTPLWYENNIGPDVSIKLSYNTLSVLAQNEPFGSKWMFNYGSYIVVDPGGAVTLFGSDGREDVFVKDVNGIYKSDSYFRTSLNKTVDGNFELLYSDGTKRIYGVPEGTNALQNFLLAVVDINGDKITFNYNRQAKMQSIEDALGRITQLNYNETGLITSVTDPFGRSAYFEYDEQRNLRSLTDMQGYKSSLGYDDNRFITYIEDAKGRTKFYIEPADGIRNGSNAYNPPGTAMWQNYRITVTDPLDNKEEYYYEGYHGIGWYVSKDNYVDYTSNRHNGSSSVAKTIYNYVRPNGRKGEISKITYPDGSFTKKEYYNNNKLKLVRDHNGLTRSFVWNDKGLLKEFTDELGNQTKIVYAPNGIDPVDVTTPTGIRSMRYDQKHQLISSTDLNGNTTQYEYSDRGAIAKVTDANGNQVNYDYNVFAQLNEVIANGKVLSEYQYDEIGRVKTVTDLFGMTTEYSYNKLDTLVETISPGGRKTSRTFATCPRLMEAETLPGERTYKYEYDSAKQLTKIIDPLQGALSIVRSKSGNMTKLVDKNKNVTEFVYNTSGKLTKKIYSDGNKTQFTYDKRRIKTITNARGVSKTYSYNDKNQLLSIIYSDDTPSVAYEYDFMGRLVKVTDGIGEHNYQYYADDKLKQIDGAAENDTIELTYDKTNRLESVSVGGTENTRYNYDHLGRVSEAVAFGDKFTFAYRDNPKNPGYSVNYPNGIVQDWLIDDIGDLAELNYSNAGKALTSYQYGFDIAGNLTSLKSNEPQGMTIDNVRARYNNLNQITQWNGDSEAFRYDADGNLIKGLLPGDIPFTATYDAENRLTSLNFVKETKQIKEVFSYGFDSMLAGYQRYENDLLAATKQFVRLGLVELQERDAANNITAEYAWNLYRPGGIGGLLTTKQGTSKYHYLYNHLGHVMATMDSNGAKIFAYNYTPYGIVSGDDFSQQPFGYSTKRSDFASGLVYFGYRFYMPNMGRWLNRDPLEETGGINLYAYVNGDPMGYVDPDGRMLNPAMANPIGLGLTLIGMCIYTDCLKPLEDLLKDLNNYSEEADDKPKECKKPKPKTTGKDGAKDVPSWAKGEKPYVGEGGKEFADRLLNDKYGKGNYPKGPKSEHNKIKKWGDRNFY